MSYYYFNKQAAELVAMDMVAADPNIAGYKTELVENNGWVIVLFPAVVDITMYGNQAEVRHPAGYRLTPKPGFANKVMRGSGAKPARPQSEAKPATVKPAKGPLVVDMTLAIKPAWMTK